MITCPACATGCPEGSRFCLRCGAPLGPSLSQPVERRVVTVLFADLVGFTRLCEQSDPEDVDRLLREYYALARGAIEAYGGVAEKFIGDAVAGVFGIPKLHEDDPERAVWAALRLIDRLHELTMADWQPRARIGVNTGPVLARLDVDPASGQGFLVGDAVNTAARLQAAAPPMRVAVGELTHDLSSRAFDFEATEDIVAKGKAEPLRSWLVKAPVARMGIDLARVFSTPFVGREVELGILRGLFEKALASSSPQYALVTGEAGIGKSRLVFEFARHIERTPDVLATWRQGRTLPYEEGTAFSALSDIVRAHCGVLESDNKDTVEAKLSRILPDDPETAWIKARLRPLLGIESSPAPREENFSAWLRFIQRVAQSRPLVLVFEDLHWAREGTLALLGHLAEHVARVPLLLIATARPELHEAHPDFASGEGWAVVDLRSLSAEETARLVDHLAGGAAAEIEPVVTERCGGNPFFTEELVRLLKERSLFGAPGPVNVEQVAQMALPDSLSALVAARLDALRPTLKTALADAAVVGQTFWPGVLAALSGTDPLRVEELLHDLARREFVRPLRTSSIEGETEYVFWHGLTREVAYSQLPRAARARRHAVVAQWMETSERVPEVADALAHHYALAYDLARIAGEDALAVEVRDPAVRALMLAGERSMQLDIQTAEQHFARALEMAGPHHQDRPRLLALWGRSLLQCGRFQEADEVLEEAAELLRQGGEEVLAAAALVDRAHVSAVLGDSRRSTLLDEALDLVTQSNESSPDCVRLLVACGRELVSGSGELERAVEVLNDALRMSLRLSQPEPPMALALRGLARRVLGDPAGEDDCARAVGEAEGQALPGQAAYALLTLAGLRRLLAGPQAAMVGHRQAMASCESHGWREMALGAGALLVECLSEVGEWDDALAEAEVLGRQLVAASNVWDLLIVRSQQVLVWCRRGELHSHEGSLKWITDTAETGSVQDIPALAVAALGSLELGDRRTSIRLLSEWVSGPRPLGLTGVGWMTPEAARVAIRCGERPLAERLMASIQTSLPVDEHASLTIAAMLFEGDDELDRAAEAYAEAAEHWHDFSVPYEEAQARLGLGRCLLALGRAPEAAPHLAEARTTFDRLGASPALLEVDGLLQESAAAPPK